MTCPGICDSRSMKRSSSRGTVALPASSSDLRRKRNGLSIGSNITRSSCVASRRHASPFALARESHFETCGELTRNTGNEAAGIEAVQPARRPCQGRSPAGVERSESLDAGEHRVIVRVPAACPIATHRAASSVLWRAFRVSTVSPRIRMIRGNPRRLLGRRLVIGSCAD